ncbi:dihydrodipicolinate reductase [Aldersonia sp. NBC_00410]|uniref:NAD(P)H-dependent amine dehydrogenase family protein n=1 Tax=Aldersonia sp. NBC_00410 TaxID=2975954 RepID=UPI0022536256|nr:dihydrodipicolinate reductase [Aldersonia sp. NBC_00410]MCX5044207.1 dihydrodipicolinate reductase [Aldersonia sp. NBC_00410]
MARHTIAPNLAAPNSLSDNKTDVGSSRPYRVVQWATGNIGARALRGVIEHPDLELAGIYVYSDDKDGRDAGELCGLGSIGVLASRSIDDIVDLDADCVLYMARALDADEICRILATGTNVVTTRGEFHHPASMDPVLRAQVEAACKLGGASIHSTGSSPGFITEAVPMVLSSIQRRLDLLAIDEFADLSQRNTPEILFDIMGFGRPPREFDEGRIAHVKSSFAPSLHVLADALGLTFDAVAAHGETATTPHKLDIAAGTLDAGTIAAQRITVVGMRAGKPLLQFRANWYCSTDLDTDWELGTTGWHISVVGDAPLEVDLRFPVPLDRMSKMAPAYTANRAVNAVSRVCAAPPGICTTLDLPQIIAAL